MIAAILTLGLSLCLPVAESAAAKPRPHPQLKVWWNEDVEALRDLPTLSITGVEPSEEPEEAPAAKPTLPKLQDPEWYREHLGELRDELTGVTTEILRLRAELGCRCTPEGGIRLDIGNPGITPDSGLQVLAARAREIESQISALEDLAHRNGVPPGLLR